MRSVGTTSTTDSIRFPLTFTAPSAIKLSAFRLEQTPRRERTFVIRAAA
eukprot:CAMPEP_0196779742 /NCGR_PEP_ID=MMETSP1104-20130614/6562_1 /TAXON_ID=33652 /ORGANISM="Cafeteria sp., Strain Caron Lab Isolate" /LENGTH=48 /DNA_ID= /DNA_START= /DNA_END= /DNA_ORIENTATION=